MVAIQDQTLEDSKSPSNIRDIFSFETFLRLKQDVEALKTHRGSDSLIDNLQRQIEKLQREHREELRQVERQL